MVYGGTGALERIWIHDNDLEEAHWIDMEMFDEDAVFYVTCCCDENFVWAFYYSKSDYERIKFVIMDTIDECDDMEELLDALEEIFVEDFEDIIVDKDDFDCDCDCENCEFIVD